MVDDINVVVSTNNYNVATSITTFIDDNSDIDGGGPSSW